METVNRNLKFAGIIFAGAFLLSGCIRLWGGATYVKNKPGDYQEKTYVLDTAELTKANQTKSITS